jgi:hypothetical protein
MQIANYSSNNIGKEMSPDNTRNDDESMIQQSFHAPDDDDMAEDQIKTYCEEGTPICFSRVSSLLNEPRELHRENIKGVSSTW